MFPTEPIQRRARLRRLGRAGDLVRAGAVALGLGLGTAFATELTITPGPPASDAAEAAGYGTGWRYFDPGFLVDHLPFKLTIGQSISYNDNVANLPRRADVVVTSNGFSRLPSRGDFYSDTTLNIASRFPVGAQTFFFNGTYAPRRYFTDTALDANNYSINGGVDFNVTDRCSGRLIGGVDHSQTPFSETVGFGVQDVEAVSFNETARCKITGHIAGLFNSGVSHLDYTGGQALGFGALSLSLNDYDQQYVAGGLEYALSSLDTLRGLATFTHRDFVNRPVLAGLARDTDQQDYQIFYNRVFSPLLDGTASGGVSVFTIPGSSATTTEPTYSFQLNYRPTPKFIATGSVLRNAGAPQSAIANVQVSDVQSLSLSYLYSAKLSLTGILSHQTSRYLVGGAGSLVAGTAYANTETDNASVIVNYRATPLLTATAAYSYVNRTDTVRSGLDAVSNVFRVGLVYTR